MSSLLVSNYLPFSESFPHNDSLNAAINETVAEFVNAKYLKPDLQTFSAFSPAVLGKPPVSRRHSSSMVGTTTITKPLLQTHTNFVENNVTSKVGLNTVLEERPRNRAYSEGGFSFSNDSTTEQSQALASSRYKTELCRPFEESGKCKYGDKCQFAHGMLDLRRLSRHPKYKTELCRTYHTSGLCPYGPRCHFIHNQDESLMGSPKQNSFNGISLQTRASSSFVSQVSKPNNLQLMSQQIRERNRRRSSFSSLPLSSSLDPRSPLLNETSLLSQISPTSTTRSFFNYVKSSAEMPSIINATSTSDRSHAKSSFPHYDEFTQRRQLDLSAGEDVFESLPTPPDSDRESATGSPIGMQPSKPQRLPIFRCLSQS